MAEFNIIYTSKDGDDYLWNGSSFDLMKNHKNEQLLYSGKNYPGTDLPEAMKKATESARTQFADDIDPSIKSIEIPVSTNTESEGHSPHMPS